MTVDPNGVNVCETEEFEAHLNTLPDGGVGVRAAIAAEKAGTLPKARIVANSKNENGRGVIELASADEAAEWAAFSQSISHPEAKFECDGAKVILPGSGGF